MKAFGWFLLAVLASAVRGLYMFFALLIPTALLTFLFGTPGYILGFVSLFFVMFCDMESENGGPFWVKLREISLWGYMLAGTIFAIAGASLTLPMAFATIPACMGAVWCADAFYDWCDDISRDAFAARTANQMLEGGA